ncbi:hypothetical protein MERGE_000021 [Pneumocystis wakefieldiae]|uniref:Helicase SWR1 n=1 Tax=Pneumocystis wakefieldiae TaxID=38082 RepID=A0A899FYU4_9ASCO|nr:hypothetical protein MERGE_000021 [Pneumocystis wakefieldiae]
MPVSKKRKNDVEEVDNKKRCVNQSHIGGSYDNLITERQEKSRNIHYDKDDQIRQLYHLENLDGPIDSSPKASMKDGNGNSIDFCEDHIISIISEDESCSLLQTEKSVNTELNDESKKINGENLMNLKYESVSDDSSLSSKDKTPEYIDTYDPNRRLPTLRIKVKVPSPIITHPFHVLLMKKYESLDDYMSSFLILNNEEIPVNIAPSLAKIEAELLNKIEKAKLKGSLCKSPTLIIKKSTEPVRTLDHLDHLISHAIYFSKLVANERRTNISRARKISGMIMSYFRRLSGADEKEKKEAEKKIKQLAKRTSLEVKKKWRLIEKEVRRRRMEKLEEEQRKVGKLHLNKILEHSAQLLEAQKGGIKPVSDFEKQKTKNIKDFNINSYENNKEHDSINEKYHHKVPYIEDDESSLEKLKIKHSIVSNKSKNDSNDSTDDECNKNKVDLDTNSSDVSRTISFLEEDIQHDDKSDRASCEKDFESFQETDEIDETDTTMDSEYDEDSQYDDDDGPGLAFLYMDENIQTNSLPASTYKVGKYSNNEERTYDYITQKINDDNIKEVDEELINSKKSFSGLETEDSNACDKNKMDDESNSDNKKPRQNIPIPFLLRGTLREYQYAGLEWLVGLYSNSVNGILADEMGLGKTIQTIALLSYLACEKGIWGPHLIVVPTSVMLNWEMEFSKFAPGFKVLTYYGNLNQRKNKRKGWYKPDTFHICITSYQLVIHDQQPFRRKKWHYLILDEAHNIKNFRSQRWRVLLNFNTERRLLLTGTPLQNNLAELWSLLYFLMPHGISESMAIDFANLKDFQEWFSKPIDRMIENNNDTVDSDVQNQISKLHQLLRPYLLRRLKVDVEKQMPKKYEHILYCRLSKRQRYLYDDFMSRAKTKETLASGNFLSIINCLMQLRKVCNHPDLFEIRPIVTSFAMSRSVVADFEIKDFLVRKRLLNKDPLYNLNLDFLNLIIVNHEDKSHIIMNEIRLHCANNEILEYMESLKSTIDYSVSENYYNFKEYKKYVIQRTKISKLQKIQHFNYVNYMRCQSYSIYGSEKSKPEDTMNLFWKTSNFLSDAVLDLKQRTDSMDILLQKYSCVTPEVVATDLNLFLLRGISQSLLNLIQQKYTNILHPMQVRLSIAFPDKRLLQYDCGKLQRLVVLLRELQAKNHRALIFTQMTRVLDILEQFLNIHGYKYLRLDGATKVEQRQILTERFNNDSRIFVFILSTRSGGLGINLTGANTVIFYDSDWNPSMDRQCQDRCHRIGQTQDVHIYRFVSEYTIEENILLKANQKRILDNLVIGEGYFTTDHLNKINWRDIIQANIKTDDIPQNEKNLERILMATEDENDAIAAKIASYEMSTDAIDFAEPTTIISNQDFTKNTSQTIQKSTITNTTQENHYVSSYTDLYNTNTHSTLEPRHIDEYMLDFITIEGCSDECFISWILMDTQTLQDKHDFKDILQRIDEIKQELQSLSHVLSQNNVNMETPLIDAEGFPRSDINIVEVRMARARINRLRNDYRELTNNMQTILDNINVLNSPQVVQKPTYQPFAKVNYIIHKSPADLAGLKEGDLIKKFGTVHAGSCDAISAVSRLVQASENKEIEILVMRKINTEETDINLILTPQKNWGGSGSLGAYIVPINI